MAITGVGDIGTSWKSIVGNGLAQETKVENDGFGLPTFSATGYWGYEGPADLTFAAASFTATGALTFTGTASLTPAAASFSGTGDVPFIGTGTFTSGAAILVGTGEEIGELPISGTGVFTTVPATFSGTVKQSKPKGGHDPRQLTRYDDFVSMGQVIKGELLGHLAPNELQSPEHTPEWTHLPVETIPPDVPPDIQPDLLGSLTPLVGQLPQMQTPTLRIRPTLLGTGAITPTTASLQAIGRSASVNGYAEVISDSVTLAGHGKIDQYYRQRLQEDALIAEFLQQLVA